MINFGGYNISKIKVGNDTISKIYIGPDLIYTQEETPQELYRDASCVQLSSLIDTGLTVTQDTVVKANIYITTGTRLWYTDNAGNTSDTNFRAYASSNGAFRVDGKYANPNLSSYYNTWMAVDHSKTGVKINNNNINKGSISGVSSFTSSTKLKICPGYKINYLEVYSNTTLVANFIPVQEISTGYYGLLDTLSGTFYGNASNTGEI